MKGQVFMERSCKNLFPRHSELSAARDGDHLWYIGIVENAHPSTSKGDLRRPSGQLSKRLDFFWAAWFPLTAHIDISVLFDIVELEPLNSQGVVLLREFDVVAPTVGM
jgi:hypothetical protein